MQITGLAQTELIGANQPYFAPRRGPNCRSSPKDLLNGLGGQGNLSSNNVVAGCHLAKETRT